MDFVAEDRNDDVLLRAQAGEASALAQLISLHQRSVYSLALRLMGTREDAEELAQDTFLQMFDSLDSIISLAHLRSWLLRAATHRCIDRLRHAARGRQRLPQSSVEVLVEPAEDPLLQRRLRTLLMQLSSVACAVMVLRYQEDLDPPEIAAIIGIPVNTVKSHLRRSLEWLREHGALRIGESS